MAMLDGQVAAVTFGTRGIGRAVAEMLLAEGATVVVNGRSPEKGAKAVAEMSASAGDRISFIPGDCAVQRDVEAFISGTAERFGRLDVAVLNAGGIRETAPVESMTDEEWKFELDINLNSTFWAMRAALQPMLTQKYGRIIHMNSLEGKRGTPGIPGYVANKHGIIGLVKACAHEVGTRGVTVNAICPGLVRTDMFWETTADMMAKMGVTNLEDLAALMTKHAATQRPTTVEEIAGAVHYLVSPAGAGITGATLNVDGGSASY